MSTIRKLRLVTNATMRTLLKASVAAGFVGVVVVAPNALQAIDFFISQHERKKRRNPRFKEQFKRSGYFDVKEISEGNYAVSLTHKGKIAANNILFDDYAIPRKEKWDGKWHLLMFDIEEKDRYFRDAMRRKIVELGLLPLQNSIYAYPYSLDEFIFRLKQAYPQQSNNIISVIAERMSEDTLETTFRQSKVI